MKTVCTIAFSSSWGAARWSVIMIRTLAHCNWHFTPVAQIEYNIKWVLAIVNYGLWITLSTSWIQLMMTFTHNMWRTSGCEKSKSWNGNAGYRRTYSQRISSIFLWWNRNWCVNICSEFVVCVHRQYPLWINKHIHMYI